MKLDTGFWQGCEGRKPRITEERKAYGAKLRIKKKSNLNIELQEIGGENPESNQMLPFDVN